MRWKFGLIGLFIPVLAFAGAGTNGGGEVTIDQITLDLLYGTFSLGASSFDYLATNVPLIIDDGGLTLLGSVEATTMLDPRIYSGITALLATGSMPETLTAPFATCMGASCTPVADGTTTFSTTGTGGDIAFSTGGTGQISDVSDPSQIIAEAELLNLITEGSLASSTPEGSLMFTVTSTDNIPAGNGDFIVDTSVTDYTIDLEEVGLTGTAPAAAAVPEPSSLALVLASFGLFALARVSKFGEAARRMGGLARASRRFQS
ncbi:MAG TPA: PEP-CTERM sorting domain-containing protein [Bryobacteraceae bacterium]|nr:PEP-CTERM sorting domain-containing protein [Bryobacteraceae bacterium]